MNQTQPATTTATPEIIASSAEIQSGLEPALESLFRTAFEVASQPEHPVPATQRYNMGLEATLEGKLSVDVTFSGQFLFEAFPKLIQRRAHEIAYPNRSKLPKAA